jgi:hypothetical protein
VFTQSDNCQYVNSKFLGEQSPLGPILSQFNPVHSDTPYAFKFLSPWQPFTHVNRNNQHTVAMKGNMATKLTVLIRVTTVNKETMVTTVNMVIMITIARKVTVQSCQYRPFICNQVQSASLPSLMLAILMPYLVTVTNY